MPQHRRVGPVSRCSKCRRYCRMVTTFLFSHVGLCGLVVGYSIVGAFTFEALEAGYELRKRETMVKERQNVVNDLWNITSSSLLLSERNWTSLAKETLQDFEITLVKAVRKEGYDGKDESPLQWTFSGALLYSIIVITTIGYGNIAPKTPWGKVVTIFYAIIGIPLLLLCLSNIGDAMAHSFRFIYWKICCYFCIRPKKRRKKHRSLVTYRPPIIQPSARIVDSGPPPLLIQKDSPKPPLKRVSSSNSSYHTAPTTNEVTPSPSTTSATASPIASHYSSTPPPFPPSPPITHKAPVIEGCSNNNVKKQQQQPLLKLDPNLDISLVPIISNKYVLQGNMDMPIDIRPLVTDSPVRTQAVFSILANKNVEFQYAMQPLPKSENNSFPWKHQRFQGETDADIMDMKSRESLDSEDMESDTKEVDVPMWLCLTLVVSYICGGAVLFTFWEKWNFLDSSYFCFVTLTTIGFGDLVPGTAVISDDNQMTLGLCSLYLLFGMALLAMSFNLVQEEVTRSVRCIGQRMGIISDDEDD